MNSLSTHSVSSCRIPPTVYLTSSIYYKVSTLPSSRQVKSSFRSYFPSRNGPIIRPKSERVTALQCHNSPLDFFYFDWFPQNVKSILINNDWGIERRFKIIKGNNAGNNGWMLPIDQFLIKPNKRISKWLIVIVNLCFHRFLATTKFCLRHSLDKHLLW